MTLEELPDILYLPGRKLAGNVLDIQLKQEDGSFAIPVWGTKEGLFRWLREGGTTLLCDVEKVQASDIVASEKDRSRVVALFQRSTGAARVLHFEPDRGGVLAPLERRIVL